MRHNARPPFVPEGQTPLDDSLNHPLLDVIKEGEKARETGNGSPYHGHSLEHCLHATGWVCRDLRIALDAAQAEIARLRAGGCARDQTTTQFCAEAAALQAENARLTTWLQLIANHPVEDSGVWEIGAREMLKCARAALAGEEEKP